MMAGAWAQSTVKLSFSNISGTDATVNVSDRDDNPIEGITATVAQATEGDSKTAKNFFTSGAGCNNNVLGVNYTNDQNNFWEMELTVSGLTDLIGKAIPSIKVCTPLLNSNGNFQNNEGTGEHKTARDWERTLSYGKSITFSTQYAQLSGTIVNNTQNEVINEFMNSTATISDNSLVLKLRMKRNDENGCFAGVKYVEINISDININIGETGYSTFCYSACYAKPAGVKAYYCVESPNPDMLTIVEWDKDYLWKQMPYILKGSANTDYTFEKYDETTITEKSKEEAKTAQEANVLKGISSDTNVAKNLFGTHIYVLSKVGGTMGFYNFGGSTLAAHKAFYAPKNTTKVNGFILDFGGLTEGVSTVMGATNLKAGFDIQGRRINKMQKGINILNGQKIIK